LGLHQQLTSMLA